MVSKPDATDDRLVTIARISLIRNGFYKLPRTVHDATNVECRNSRHRVLLFSTLFLNPEHACDYLDASQQLAFGMTNVLSPDIFC